VIAIRPTSVFVSIGRPSFQRQVVLSIPERSISDPELAPVREALDLILTGHEPYPAVAPEPEHDHADDTAASHIVTPLMRMRSPDGEELSFFATVATFGTATEVTTSELSIELTFPADAATAETMRNLLTKGVHGEPGAD
jgi:hypothetical protein